MQMMEDVTLSDLYAYNALFGIEFTVEDGKITDAVKPD